MSDPDYRFSLANERTFLAWARTSVALIAGGLIAAKAIEFESEVWRWVVAVPPIIGGAAMALRSHLRRRAYDRAIRSDRPLPAGGDAAALALGLTLYGVVALVAVLVDG